MTSLRFLPEQIELLSMARLKPYTKNARTHSDDQIAKIAASLVEYGWTAPVMVADDGEIVAGETTGRRVFAIEISPQYVDVAVRRWQTAAGKTATLDGDGRTFDAVAGERLPRAA
jgi:hypothetical protein